MLDPADGTVECPALEAQHELPPMKKKSPSWFLASIETKKKTHKLFFRPGTMRSIVHPVVEMAETMVTERALKQNLNAKTVAFIGAAVQKAATDHGHRFDHRMFLSKATAGLNDLEYKAR